MVRKLPDNNPQYPPHREDIYDLARVIKRRVWFLESRMQTAETNIQDLTAGGGGGSGGAPTGAHYVVTQPNGSLTNAQLVTDSASIQWDTGTPGSVSAGAIFGTTSGTVCQGDDARLSNDRTADSLRTASGVVLVGAASAPSPGQVLTATSSADAEWQTPSGGGSDDIVHAEGGNANVVTTGSFTAVGQKTLTVAAGDIIEVHCAGTLETQTASVLWEWAVELTANGNTHTCVVRDNGTIAASAVNKAPWIWRSTSAITGSTCRTTALNTRASPVSSTATGASTSGSTIRMNWKHTSADFTGSCTVRLLVRTTVGQSNVYTLVDSFWIQQTPTRP